MVFNLYYYVQQLSIINTMAGSSDLNLLKSWNPKLQKNKAKVSKVEEDAIEEERKIQQKQKEKELQDLASGKGLDWNGCTRMPNTFKTRNQSQSQN